MKDSALTIFAAAFFGLVILNTLKMDWIQRTGLGIGILGFSIYLAQSIYVFNESKKNPSSPSRGGSIAGPPTAAKEEKSRLEHPPTKAVHPVKDPLEIVAFRSDHGISIANNGPSSVHALNLLVKGYAETKSFALGIDIAPGKTSEQKWQVEGLHHARTIMRLADTWEDHFKKARELYSACGMQWTFFSPSDISLQQIKENYTKQKLILGYQDVSGVLYYRVKGLNKTEQQVVTIVETITVNDDACPKSLVRLSGSDTSN